jgi:cation:H+ antiporter
MRSLTAPVPCRHAVRRGGARRHRHAAVWLEILALTGGAGLLTLSADRFVAGAAAVACNLRVPPLIIGLTVVGIGTSSPEILVSAMAAWQGNRGIAVGNAIGSNIINIALVLGLTALIHPLDVHSSIPRRELPVLLGVMLVAWLLISDDTLGRFDGLLLVAGVVPILVWMTVLGLKSRESRDALDEEFRQEMHSGMGMRLALFWLLLGFLALLLSSRLLIWGAASIALQLGVSELVIGIVVVAFGTSLPELAASLASAIKKEHDIAVGNVIGSNIFNLLAVLGLPGLINPGAIDPAVGYRDFPVMFLITLTLFGMAYGLRGPGRITRTGGALLLATYIGYQTLLYFSATAGT